MQGNSSVCMKDYNLDQLVLFCKLQSKIPIIIADPLEDSYSSMYKINHFRI